MDAELFEERTVFKKCGNNGLADVIRLKVNTRRAAEGRAGEDRAGVVVAGADHGVVTLDWTNAGDGA